MPAIKPISELRNYNTVLREVTADTPVFLTKNGHGRFAIVDIRAYEKLRTELELMSALAEGEESARKRGWVSLQELPRLLPSGSKRRFRHPHSIRAKRLLGFT
jgi:prevent-host-death family protein